MTELGSQAVVLGAGIAGLLTARVLSEFYESVTVLERDRLPDHPAQRKGVPQGHHLHNFLSRGTQVIGELLPGFLDELVAAGAVAVNDGTLSGIYARIGGYELCRTGRLTDPRALAVYQASRPFMEFHLRRRVSAIANITILDDHEAVEPLIGAEGVMSVRTTNRRTAMASNVSADLVIDATGRAARTPVLLDSHGFGCPQTRIESTWGYSSQLLRIPEGRIAERMVFVNQGTRAPVALLVAYEADTWMLAVARRVDCGPPPTNFVESLAAAEQILPATTMAALRDATPLRDIAISRSTAALWRRYDQTPSLPQGLLVVGDALCHLNPIYGQGMTMAALQALALRDCLCAGGTDHLAPRFYDAAAAAIGPVWAMNAANDRVRSPGTPRTLRRRLRGWTQKAALQAAANDIRVAEKFFRVTSLVDPPSRLQDPRLLRRILLVSLRHPRGTPRVIAGDQPQIASLSRADEEAIRALIDRQVKGWNTGDPDAYASVFTLDADYVTFLGSRHKGREAIAMSYAPLFEKLLRGSRLCTQITQTRYLTPDVALIQARAAVTTQMRRWHRSADRVNTSIAVRGDDGWLLAASQNTTHRRFAERVLGQLISRRSHA
jgi:uncharacterized protein (TIGR02246 family)